MIFRVLGSRSRSRSLWLFLEKTLLLFWCLHLLFDFNIQSTPVILKSKGPSEIIPDMRTSTYQICRIELKINQTTTFHK